VAIYGSEHPTQHVSLYFNKNLFEGRLKCHAVIAETSIGHDVWIGHGAVVLRGRQVGNGAIIGAGAIVTHDVPDFAVVVGNPARILRMRFDEEISGLLLQSQWWLRTTEELQPFEELFHLDLVAEREKGIALLTQMIGNQQKIGEDVITAEA